MNNTNISRRQFLKGSAAVAGLSMFAHTGFTGAKNIAGEQVLLGKTGLTLSRLGIGTGTHGGRIQRDLGHKEFNRLVRYAYDRGITFLDTADGYKTHTWIKEAISGLPREKFFIMTKMGGIPEDPQKEIDRFRQELGTEYIDCLLIHCKINAEWEKSHAQLMDVFSDAKQKGIIRAHGVSCHSIPALQSASQLDWVDVNLVRINPQGLKIDTMKEQVFDESNIDNLPPVLEQMKIMREKGHGIIGMKIIGEGDLTNPEERRKSIHFAMQPGLLDAVTIGFKSVAEINEAIQNISLAFG